MAFPATVLPLVTEVRVGVEWVEVQSGVHGVRRERGAGVRISRKPLSWARSVGNTTSDWVFKNPDKYWSPRHPNSVTYGALGLNSQVRHRLRWVRDTFTRTLSGSWGSTEGYDPKAWVNVGGFASNYDVTGTRGTHTQSTVNAMRSSTVQLPIAAFDVEITASWDQVATGAPYTSRINLGSDGSNFYEIVLTFSTAGAVTMVVNKAVAGVVTTIVSSVSVGTYGVGTQYRVRLQRSWWGVSGVNAGYSLIRVKAWSPTLDQPQAWTATVVDGSLSTFTQVQLRSRAEAGNTDVNPVCAFDNLEVNDWRFWGELSSLEPQADDTGLEKYAQAQASGVMRRLSAGENNQPLKSAMYRSTTFGAPIAYWPLTDAVGATSGASAVGGPPMRIGHGFEGDASTWSFGTFTPPAGSEPVVSLTDNTNLTGSVYGGSGTAWRVEWISKGAENAAGYMLTVYDTDGNRYEVYSPYTGSEVAGFQAPAVVFAEGPYAKATYLSTWTHWAVVAEQSGANLKLTLYVNGVLIDTSTSAGAYTLKPVATIVVNRQGFDVAGIGHVAVFNGVTPTTGWWAMSGYDGETAGARLVRLFAEENVYFELLGTASETAAMGPQPRSPLPSIVKETAEVDQGVLFELRDALGMGYRPLAQLFEQTGPQVNYSLAQLTTFQTRDDTSDALNLVTAERSGGVSVTAETLTGPRSTQDPPNGVGVYPEQQTWNVATDGQVQGLAGWRRWRGSWDEVRYPSVGVGLHRAELTSLPSLAGGLAAIDLATYFSVINPRDDLPPDEIRLLCQGYTERLANFERDLTWDTAPAGPYFVGVLAATTGDTSGLLGYLDPDTFTLNVDRDPPTTTFPCITIPAWTTVADDFPMYVRFAGEVVQVTASSGGTTPNLTVVRSINGVVKAQLAGTPGEIVQPIILVP